MKKHLTILLVIFMCFLNYSKLDACSVPVFRYAMEHWLPDSYEVVIFHQGELSGQDSVLLENFKKIISNRSTTLNIWMKQVNLNKISKKKVKSMIRGPIPDVLPAMAIWIPRMKGHTPPLWIGSLSTSTINEWLNSPKRKELTERLIAGDSGVWLFLESGDASKDSTAYFHLKTTLNDIIQKIKKYRPLSMDVNLESDYSYQFSILRLPASDLAEKSFYKMLLNSDPELKKYINELMVFPVYGRGRVLYALVGEGISKANIEEAAMFITGPCGCQIKMLNPGVDLLIQANWGRAIFPGVNQQDPLPELTGVMPDNPPFISDENQSQSSTVKKSHSNFWTLTIGSTLILLLLVIVGSIFIIKQGVAKK